MAASRFLGVVLSQFVFALGISNNTDVLPTGVVYLNETDLEEKMAQNEALMQDFKVNGSARNGNCNKDMTHKMPVCYQICDEWCWATGVTMTGDYYKGQNYCQGFECSVASHEFGGKCCPYTNSCQSKYNAPASSCNRGGTPSNMRDASTYFSGGSFTATGPLSQNDLDKALNSGRVVQIAVRWPRGGGHALLIGGCGNGYYYLHDPWGWYSQMGYKQPAAWQGLTYDQLLQYPSPTAVGRWSDSIFWSWSDSERHAEALKQADAFREMKNVESLSQTVPVVV